MAHFILGEQSLLLDFNYDQHIVLCIDQNNTKGKLEYVSERSGVVIPYKACHVLVCGALFMSMGILKLH